MTDQSWFEDHAFSRYARVTMSVIEALQADYFAGRDLAASMPHIDAARATIIVAESLEADLLTNTLQQRFSKQVPPGIYPEVPSDWTRACLAGVFREVEEMAREQGNQEQEGNWWALAWSSLEAVCRSPVSCRRALAEAKPCDPSGGGSLNCFGTIQYKYHSIMAVLCPRAVYVGV